MKHALAIITVLIALHAGVNAQEEVLTGGHTIELAGPIDDATAREVKARAYDAFRKEVQGWLEVNVLGEWDLSNGIDRQHLDRFTRALADRAKQESKFNGPRWSYAYNMTASAVAKAAEDWNTRYDALAVRSYVQFSSAAESRNLHDIYVFGIRTVFYSRAHLGPHKSIPGKSGKDYIYETNQGLKELLEKLSITTSDAVLAGKPGFKPDNDIVVAAAFDGGVPLPGLKVSIVLHGGPKLATVSTGSDGKASLGTILTPYVANGAFFNVVPNPGAEIDSLAYFQFEDMGLGLSRSYSQTLMFKILRPTYTLEYRMTAASDIVVPRDVADKAYMVKFLRDSCHLELAAAGADPDLHLQVTCQVSGYENDAAETFMLKSEMRATIEEKRSARHSIVQRDQTLQKSYRTGTEPPMGLYFWETVRSMGNMVKTTLLSL